MRRKIKGQATNEKLKCTVLGQNIRINPVIASPGAGVDLDSLGQQIDELLIPATHLTASVPERAHNSHEVSPFLVSQVVQESWALQVGSRWVDDVELRLEVVI